EEDGEKQEKADPEVAEEPAVMPEYKPAPVFAARPFASEDDGERHPFEINDDAEQEMELTVGSKPETIERNDSKGVTEEEMNSLGERVANSSIEPPKFLQAIYGDLRDPASIADVSSTSEETVTAERDVGSELKEQKAEDDNLKAAETDKVIPAANEGADESKQANVAKPKGPVPLRRYFHHSVLPFLSHHEKNSLHYGISILLTHCPNLRSLRLHLPAPSLPQLPIRHAIEYLSLTSLELHQRITDNSLRSLFPSALADADPRLTSLILHRAEVCNDTLEIIAPNLTKLTTLLLPAANVPTPTPSRSARPSSRAALRVPPPSFTHDALANQLRSTLRPLLGSSGLTTLDISALSSDPPSPIRASVTAAAATAPNPAAESTAGAVNPPPPRAALILSAISDMQSLRSLTLAIDASAGLTLPALSSTTLPKLWRTLQELRVLSRPCAVALADSTLDEEDVVRVLELSVAEASCATAAWDWAAGDPVESAREDVGVARRKGFGMRRVVLEGLDFVGGGGGKSRGGGGGSAGLRFYFGVLGDPWRVDAMVDRFRALYGDVELKIRMERR
ncbi:hypothetical protein HK101_000166, partial [Irineochytrium annulatum]